MYDQARIARLRRGHEDENDRDGARYLIDELESAIIRGATEPTGSQGTRYRALMVALQATTTRLGIHFTPDYDSLGSLVKAHPGLGKMGPLLRGPIVRGPFGPLLEALDDPMSRHLHDPVDQPLTGWAKVDAEIAELRSNAAGASSGHDRGAVGRLCREVFVSLASASYDAARHGPLPDPPTGGGGGTVNPRLTAVISVEAAGGSRDKLRAVVAKSLDLANSLQHRKEPSDVEAMICADATIFVAAAIRRLTRAEGVARKAVPASR